MPDVGEKLASGMTFKQFVNWCNERACDGCWGMLEAMQCIEVMRDVRQYPFWKREEMWKHHHMRAFVEGIVKETNQMIQERFGDGNA